MDKKQLMEHYIALLPYADHYFREKKWDDAVELYTRIVHVIPDHFQANQRLGFILHQQGKFEQAYQHLSHLAVIDPAKNNDPQYHFDLGLISFYFKNFSQAVIHYLQSAKLFSGIDLLAYKELPPADNALNRFNNCLMCMACYSLCLDRYHALEQLCEQVLQTDANYPLAKQLKAAVTDCLYQDCLKAQQHHQAGKWEQAKKHYSLVLAKKMDHVGALQGLGILHWQQGKRLQAIALLKQARLVAPQASKLDLAAIAMDQELHSLWLQLQHSNLIPPKQPQSDNNG